MGVLCYAKDGGVFPTLKLPMILKVQIAMLWVLQPLLQLLLMVAQQMRFQTFG